jgi:hypothetical protein
MGVALRSLVILGLSTWFGWMTVGMVRRGVFAARWGAHVSRRHNPLQFWVSVLVTGSVCLIALYQAVRIAGGR